MITVCLQTVCLLLLVLLLLLLLLLQDRATLVKLLPTLLQAQAGGTQRFKFVALLWQDEQQQQPGSRPASRLRSSTPSNSRPSSRSSSSSSSEASNGSVEYEQAVAELAAAGVPVLGYEAVLAAGGQLRAVGPFQPAACSRGSLATLVYTSGTTGGRGSSGVKGLFVCFTICRRQQHVLCSSQQVNENASSCSMSPASSSMGVDEACCCVCLYVWPHSSTPAAPQLGTAAAAECDAVACCVSHLHGSAEAAFPLALMLVVDAAIQESCHCTWVCRVHTSCVSELIPHLATVWHEASAPSACQVQNPFCLHPCRPPQGRVPVSWQPGVPGAAPRLLPAGR
jgi:hypothetical protein